MILNKYAIIFLTLLLIIISLSVISYLFKENSSNKTIIEKKNIQFVESFSNQESTKNEFNNLIVNGNFENGKDSPNHTTQSGYNKIIMINNPGLSSYVLEQKKTNNLTYYEFMCENEKNSKYNLYFWFSIKNNNIEELNLEKLIQVKIQNDDFSNYMPRLNYNIVQKVILSNEKDNVWYLLKYDFISSNTTKDKIQLYLNYSTNLQFDTYYFTDIAFYRVLIDAENFIYNNKLVSYVDGYHYESNTPTFHDLSGRGNDLFWSNIPVADYTKGSLNMLNSKLVGFPADKLSNKNFSIIFCINKNFQNIASDNYVDVMDEEENYNDLYLLSVPGNERYSFEIQLKDNYIYLINGNNKYKSKNEIILYNKCLIGITYEKSIINIFYDGISVLSEKIKKIYFSPDNLLINRNKNLDYNIYSILFYNRAVYKKELDDIRTYFITNQDKNFSAPDINIYHMNNSASYSVTNVDNNLFKPFNKKINNNGNFDNIFIDTFDNQNYKVKEGYSQNCSDDCKNLCTSFSSNTDKYNDCTSNCQSVLQSCQSYCEEEEGNNSIYCKSGSTSGNTFGSTSRNTSGSTTNNGNCPTVYKKNGNYMVYIPPNSTYAKSLNYSGDRSYGNNLSKARYTYNLNFPDCPTPSELTPGGGKSYIETCPYVVNEANPCHMSVCSGVDWSVKDYKDLKVSKNCKKVVSNYCQINYNIDEKCDCWNPANKNNQECIEFRRHFEDPNDYCSPNQFKIEEHPDFNKYIKKDNIPCWGCKIE